MDKILSLFGIENAVVKPLGEGLINDTYVVTCGTGARSYVLQRINTAVFPSPETVMRNIGIVTAHIREKLVAEGACDIDRRVLTFLPARDGRLFAEVDGQVWRVMLFVENSMTKSEVNVENAYKAGEAFGQFQKWLADVPETLEETIKDFHNMEFRLAQLRQAVAENRAGRVQEEAVLELLAEFAKREEEMTAAERLYREGKLPKRICHCDTKVNNMLFDASGEEVLCVIDLDTVMPSFIFSDVGDFLRTAASTVAEDCGDFDKIAFRGDIYEAFVGGYLSSARSFLTPLEIEMIPYAAKLFPYMQSVRFLWDYLNGDHYWKCKFPTHNLVRAQNQFHYLRAIEKYFE